MDSEQKTIESYLEWAPLSLALREVSRIRAFKLLDCAHGIFKAANILDVGCGDGRWWRHLLPDKLEKVHGIDVNLEETRLAAGVISVQRLDVTASDFGQQLERTDFDLVVGNCSLEHVFDLDKALCNIASVLIPGGRFVLFVPTPYWAMRGHGMGFLHKVSPRLSMALSGLFNGFFQHWHLYNHGLWSALLRGQGLKLLEVYGVGNRRADFLFRLFLPTAFLSFLVKSVTGRYLNSFLAGSTPRSYRRWLGGKVAATLDERLRSAEEEDIFEYVILCEK